MMNENSGWMQIPYFDDWVEGIIVKLDPHRRCSEIECSYNSNKKCVHYYSKWKTCIVRLKEVDDLE